MKFTTDELTEIVEVIESNGVPLKVFDTGSTLDYKVKFKDGRQTLTFESERRKIVWSMSYGITASILHPGISSTEDNESDEWLEVLTNYPAVDVADGLNALRLMNVIEHTEVIDNEA